MSHHDKYTTLAVGEEDPTTKPKSEEEVYTTLAIGEEDDGTEPVATDDSAFGAF